MHIAFFFFLQRTAVLCGAERPARSALSPAAREPAGRLRITGGEKKGGKKSYANAPISTCAGEAKLSSNSKRGRAEVYYPSFLRERERERKKEAINTKQNNNNNKQKKKRVEARTCF